MPITAGSISIARRINTGDYSHKEARAEVHWTAEGEEGPAVISGQAGRLALFNVAETLATVVTIENTPEIVLANGLETGETPEQKQKRHRRTKAEMEAARAGLTNAEATTLLNVAEKFVADPTPVSAASGTTAGTMDGGTAAASPSPAENSPDDWGSGPLAEISDKELNGACNATMNRIKNRIAIQGVIQQYTDGAVSTIPPAQRTEFLQKLKAL